MEVAERALAEYTRKALQSHGNGTLVSLHFHSRCDALSVLKHEAITYYVLSGQEKIQDEVFGPKLQLRRVVRS